MPHDKIIESCDNQQIKLLKKLSQKKYRKQHGKFVVENYTIIHDALKSGHDFLSLFISKNFKEKYPEKYKYLQTNSKSTNFFTINDKLNKCYSQLATPSGISAIYNISAFPISNNKSTIYLNHINDPGNLGTIMRTMLAFDFHNLIVDEKCADIYNIKTISAAKDALFKINILHDKDRTWLTKNKHKLPIYVSNAHQGKDLDNFQAADQFCLVMGSETHGVSPEIINMANENIKINLSKNIESLNVAIATAIFLYKLNPKGINSSPNI